jgi:hypothetical protein
VRLGLLYLTERLLIGKHRDGNIGAASKDFYGRTPLSLAAIVKLLLDTGKVDGQKVKAFTSRTVALMPLAGM